MLNLNYESEAVWALSLDYIPHSFYGMDITNQQTGKTISVFIRPQETRFRTQNLIVHHATENVIAEWQDTDKDVIRSLGYLYKNNVLYLYLEPARYVYSVADEKGFITIYPNDLDKTYTNGVQENKVYNG